MPTESLYDIIRAAQQQMAFTAAEKAEPKQAEPVKPPLIGICVFCNKWVYANPIDQFKMEAVIIPIGERMKSFTFACVSCAREKHLINY